MMGALSPLRIQPLQLPWFPVKNAVIDVGVYVWWWRWGGGRTHGQGGKGRRQREPVSCVDLHNYVQGWSHNRG